jgi:hypothetical protein
MPLYRFYRIVSSAGEECYIGHTTGQLCNRMAVHRYVYRKGQKGCPTSRLIFAKYGVETCSIVLISEQEYETKQEALQEERRLIDERRDYAVNEMTPCITEDEHKERHRVCSRNRYTANKETLDAYYAERIPCDVCGALSSRANLARHKRTKSCQAPPNKN